jgi:hypothetical protein
MNFVEQMKTIDICSCGPLRISAGFFNGGILKEGSKIAMITSQGGSVEWRTVQNPNGHDYGHHVSAWANKNWSDDDKDIFCCFIVECSFHEDLTFSPNEF